MTLEEFNKVYRYKKDIDKFGFNEVWEVPKIEDDGYVYGDCESYCRYLKKNIEWFKDWEYWYCKLNGNGHCVLIKDGMIIDCNVKDVISLDTYCKMYNVIGFKKYSLFTIGAKIMVSWGYLLWKKLLG